MEFICLITNKHLDIVVASTCIQISKCTLPFLVRPNLTSILYGGASKSDGQKHDVNESMTGSMRAVSTALV